MVIRINENRNKVLVMTTGFKHLLVGLLSLICLWLLLINQDKIMKIVTVYEIYPTVVLIIICIARFFLTYTGFSTLGEWFVHRKSPIVFHSKTFKEAGNEKFFENYIIIETNYDDNTILCIDKISDRRYKIFNKYYYMSFDLFRTALKNQKKSEVSNDKV